MPDQELPPDPNASLAGRQIPDAENIQRMLKALVPEYMQEPQGTAQHFQTPNPQSGKLPSLEPYSPMQQATMGAMDAASMVGPGGGVKAAASAAPKIAGMAKAIFAGPLALTADKAALRKAMDMSFASRLGSGVRPSEIFKETGWWQGPDKRWRFEIPDTNAVSSTHASIEASDPKGVPLPTFLRHKELYDAYPPLRNVTVDNNAPAGYGGMWDPVKGHINMNPTLPRAQRTSVGLHEVQHAVQMLENLPPGANVEEMQEIAKGLLKEKGIDPIPSHLEPTLKKSASEAYHRSAGETEARNVQTRYGIMNEWANGPHGEIGAERWRRQAIPTVTTDVHPSAMIYPSYWTAHQPQETKNAVMQNPLAWQVINSLMTKK
jgi:hypothetical protein